MDKITDHKSSAEEISAKRRKLLKSAASAAPVIATLHSGAAFANASAHQCVNTVDTDPPKKIRKNQNDAWVRQSVTRYKFKKKNSNNRTRWLYDFNGNGGGSGIYYKNEDNDADGVGDTRTIDASKWDVDQQETVYVIVLYETDGTYATEKGYHPKVFYPTSGYKPLTATCLCSVDPNASQCIP